MFGMITIRSWRVLVPALILLLSLSAAGRAEDKITREFTRELNLEPGRQVALDNPVGVVKISGWDRNVVQVKAVKKCDKKWFDEHGKKAEEYLDGVEIDIVENNKGIRIETRFMDMDFNDGELGLLGTCKLVLGMIRRGLNENMPVEVNYEVMVPARVDLDVKCDIGELTVSDVEGKISARGAIGKIQLADIRGMISARNEIGEIEVRNAVGSVDARTSMGQVDVDIAELGPEDRVCLESGMGQVRLSIPTEARVDLTTDCGMGGFNNGLGEGFVGKVKGGDVRGKFNGGGASVNLKTGMGAINIASR